MPSIQNSFLPLPRNWQEFETIVQDALKIRYNCKHFSKNRRSGQKQNGVDIFAKLSKTKNYGAQCKLTFNKITANIIDQEISNAKNFKTPLTHLDICTTSPRDQNIQSNVWNLNCEFSVNILFQDDITNELEKDSRIFAMHFPYLSDDLTVEEKFNNDFRNLISYVVNTDPGSEAILLDAIDEVKTKLNAWIMPDLLSKDKIFKKTQKKILSNLQTWLSYMNPFYMHYIWDGKALYFNNYPSENLEELKKNTFAARQKIYDEYKKLCDTGLF